MTNLNQPSNAEMPLLSWLLLKSTVSFFVLLLLSGAAVLQAQSKFSEKHAVQTQTMAQPAPGLTVSTEEMKALPDKSPSNTGATQSPQGISLEESIDQALQNNLEIQAQKNSLTGAFHKVSEQIGQTKPQVAIQNLYNLQGKVPGFGATKLGDTETNITQVSLKQPLYSFGRLEIGLDMVREQYKAEDAAFEVTRTDIIHRVIRSFLELLKARNRVRIAQETILVLNEHLRLVENLFQSGVVLNTDVSTTKVKVLEARQRLIEEQNSHDIAEMALCDLLRLPEGTVASFQEIPPMPLDVATTIENREQQPEMQNLSHLVKVNKDRYSIEKRSTLPMVGFQYVYSTGNQFLENFKNWNALVMFEVPIFDSGVSRARIEQAKAGWEQMQNLRASTRQKFSLAIQQSARKVREMQEKSTLSRQIEQAASENYTNLQNQFKEGAVINTDVLSAQLVLTNARLGLTNAYYDYVAFLADHFRSLGNIDEFLELIKHARMNVSGVKGNKL